MDESRHALSMGESLRTLSMGERAFLVECSSLDEVMSLSAGLAAAHLPGVEDIVPAARTVLVMADSPRTATRLKSTLQTLPEQNWSAHTAPPVSIDVIYDGEDLSWVSEHLGLSADALISWHSGQTWRCAFTGFAPGFAYCVAQTLGRDVPRRPAPRPVVPAGALGLAGEFSGVYPSASPGGWQLIGRINALVWNPERKPPALIGPGDAVRYVAVREFITVVDAPEPQPVSVTTQDRAGEATDTALEIVSPGWFSVIEDGGRIGLAHMGVSPAGAWDAEAAALGNKAVGNEQIEPLIEALGALSVRARGEVTLAWVDGAQICGPVSLKDGEEFTAPAGTLRGYLAVAGGFAVPTKLGSSSRDCLAGLGPEPLCSGDIIPIKRGDAPVNASLAVPDADAQDAVADSPSGATPTEQAWHGQRGTSSHGVATSDRVATSHRIATLAVPVYQSRIGTLEGAESCDSDLSSKSLVLNVTMGPRDNWITDQARVSLTTQDWEVSAESNRIGVRLIGDPLPRAIATELPSEGMVVGAIQLPPSGLPVLLMRDHPITGGYPVIAVIDDAGINALAYAAPGTKVRFVAKSKSDIEN